MSIVVDRPLLRYHGGKFLLAKWIIQHFPKHKVYVEPFGGAASVLIQKKRSFAEIYNDLDGEIVNLFKVCRDSGDELQRLIYLTPFSRSEFVKSYEKTNDQIEQARRTIIRSFMGFGSGASSGKITSFRANGKTCGANPASDWRNYAFSLPVIIERLRGVTIENKNAFDVMQKYDCENTLHYLDPPYVLDTRHNGQKTNIYKYEMTNQDHSELLTQIKKLKGKIIISGYDSDLYNDSLGWRKIERKSLADGAKERKEVLWLSPNCEIQNLLFN